MILYCDESGGTDGDLFCVSAFRIDPQEAARALKSFRRRTGHQGEVKGHRLLPAERVLLLDLAFRAPGAAAVVACDGRTPLGGWAASTLLPESTLRRELLTEACIQVLGNGPDSPCQGVVVDGGRYPNAVLEAERLHLDLTLRTHGLLTAPAHPRLITYEKSEAHAGLQLTDVLANTIHRLLRDAAPGCAPSLHGLPEAMQERLEVRHVGLPTHRPDWLGPPPY